MEFRPCIDIHNGKVKQIVGGSLTDHEDQAKENFVAVKDASYYAELYKEHNLKNGHIILLNPVTSEYYEATKAQAMGALMAYPGGMQIGGGITVENAGAYLDAGASHVIVTSYVFRDGKIDFDRLKLLSERVGKKQMVLDLSCRKKADGAYYIVTDRWQKFTAVQVTEETLNRLAGYCDEYLIHAVDVEGKSGGIETELVQLLGKSSPIPATYAGGVHAMEDMDLIRKLGNGAVHVTIGSALDLFGGYLKFEDVMEKCKEKRPIT